MAFDVNGARAAGYTDAEIVDYLGGKSGLDVSKARQAGYSEKEILDYLISADKTSQLNAYGSNSVALNPEAGLSQPSNAPTATGLDASGNFYLNVVDTVTDVFHNAFLQFGLRVVVGLFLYRLLASGLRGGESKKPSQLGRRTGACLAGISVLNANIYQSGLNYIAGAVVQVATAYSIGFLAGYLWRTFRPCPENNHHSEDSKIYPKENIENVSVSDECYLQALKEYESSNRDQRLWARLFAELEGGENKVKAAYIKKRANVIVIESK